MSRPFGTMAFTLAVLFGAATLVSAQGRFGGGQSAFGGGTGSTGFGSGGFGASGMGRSGLGSSGMSGFGGSGSGFGSGGFGSGFGSSGSGGFGSSGFGNSGFGNNAFGGQGMNGGGAGGVQSFVGRDSGDMQAVMTQMGRAGTQFFSQMSRNMGGRNRNRQQQQTEENKRPPVRIRLELGFPAQRPVPTTMATSLNTRLAKLAVDHSLGQPQVAVEGDTVVLRGTAQSENQRRVLEQFILLEPGVMSVRNEMIVAPPTSEETLPVPSSAPSS